VIAPDVLFPVTPERVTPAVPADEDAPVIANVADVIAVELLVASCSGVALASSYAFNVNTLLRQVVPDEGALIPERAIVLR
jgi:hypothetical protein